MTIFFGCILAAIGLVKLIASSLTTFPFGVWKIWCLTRYSRTKPRSKERDKAIRAIWITDLVIMLLLSIFGKPKDFFTGLYFIFYFYIGAFLFFGGSGMVRLRKPRPEPWMFFIEDLFLSFNFQKGKFNP